ncbi:MAG: porin [Xanthobacteraceae bacterium]|nr:porin [Xanthobacteraceae bacterium]
MKLVKSLLLGSATALVAVSGASAADLGVKKPSPVEYVKVCNTYGAGFFYIPGSNTCLKIGGRVRAEYYFGENRHQGFNAGSDTGFRAQGHIQLDGRTATEYGTLRSFVRLILNSRTGNAVSGTQQRYGTSTVATGADFAGQAQTNLDFVAFIQFAGFTAGRVGSFFDFYTGDINWQGTGSNGISTLSGATNLFAYTATFGSGFSATLSVEDPVLRRQLVLPGNNALTNTNVTILNGRGSFYGGAQMPDIVGNVRVEQAWGSAQIAGVVHEVAPTRVGNVVTTDANGAAISRDYGWGVQGGLKINMPFIAAGDALWLQAGYGQGTAGYINGGGFNGSGSAGSGVFDPYAGPGVIADGYVSADAAGRARLTLSDTYAVFAGFQHYWTPTIRQSIFGSYSETSYGRGTVPLQTAGFFGAGGVTSSVQWQVGSQLVWSPVKDLDIGVEVQYQGIENNNRGGNYRTGVLPVGVVRSSEQVIGRFRVQRDF